MTDFGKNYLLDEEEEVVTPTPQEVVEDVAKESTPGEEVVEDTVPKEEVVIEPQTPTEEPEQVTKTAEEPKEEVVTTQPEPTSIDDERLLSILKEKSGRDINSLEDFLKEPEPIVDKYSKLSEKTQQFLKFHEETNRDYDEFLKLDTDYTKLSPLEAARERAFEMSGGELDKSEIDEFLEKKLGVDLSNPKDLEKFDIIELKDFGKDYIQRKIKEQELYKQPIKANNPVDGPEMVTLEGGMLMPKAEYDKKVSQRNTYIENIKKSSDNITSSVFKIKVDDNGTDKVMSLSYDYSKEEVLNMASSALDIDNSLEKLFGTKDGLDYAKLQEGLQWASESFREKAIGSIVKKAIAQNTKELLKDSTNANFRTNKKIPGTQETKNLVIPGTEKKNGATVKYEF